MKSISELEEVFVGAIEENRLRSTIQQWEALTDSLPPDVRDRINQAKDAVAELDSDVEKEMSRVGRLFSDHDVPLQSIAKSNPDSVTHGIRLTVDRTAASVAAALLEGIGYESAAREDMRVWSRFIHFYDSTTFWSATGTQFRIRLQWKANYQLSGRVGNILKPTMADLSFVPLPGRMRPAYILVRVVRRCLGFRRRAERDLGPFLGTPIGLIQPLLEFSGLKTGQQFVDLGSGDGRVLIAAAESYACHAVGYETDEKLLSDAKSKVTCSGLDQRVKIFNSDARYADVSCADVVFIFLPVDAIKSLLPSLRERMKPGSVLVAHEQQRLTVGIASTQKLPMIHAGGVTVAHKWQN